MGLFQKDDGGVMDVIRCDEQNYLIWKWHPQGTNSNNSQRANSIRWGSSLRVKDGSVAVFVYSQGNGVQQDYIVGPYDEMITTNNFPVLASLVGVLYQGGSPFQAEVYFINLANLNQLRFAVPYFDVFDPRFLDLGVPVAVRGAINYKITDYIEFIKLHRLENFNMNDFQKQVTDAVMRYVKGCITNAPGKYGISVVQLESRISEVTEIIEADLKENLQKDFGVTVSRVDISAIEVQKESPAYKKLFSLTNNKVTSLVQGAQSVFSAMGAGHIAAKRMNNTFKGKEPSSASGIGELGQKMTTAIGGVFGEKKGKNSPPPLPISTFYVAINGKQKGPYDIPKLQKLVSDGVVSGESLVWKDGMENWKRAKEVEELSVLFAENPPPISGTD